MVPPVDHVGKWQELVGGPDRAAAVRAHLAPLASTPECGRLLDRMVERLQGVAIVEDRILELEFDHGEDYDEPFLLGCGAPYDGPAGTVPASMLAVARLHNGIGAECYGGGSIGFDGVRDGRVSGGCWDPSYLTEARAKNSEFLARMEAAGLDRRDIDSPGDHGQNWLIHDPVERNVLGEPVLYFVSHEDCVAVPVQAARDLPFGAQLIRVLAQDLLDERLLEEIHT